MQGYRIGDCQSAGMRAILQAPKTSRSAQGQSRPNRAEWKCVSSACQRFLKLLALQGCADIVAKVREDHFARNNRIKTGGFLNQRCAWDPHLELMLRGRRLKIVLQQYLPRADSCTAANGISTRSPRRQWQARRAER